MRRLRIRLAAFAAVISIVACNVAPPVTVGQKDSLVGQGKVVTVTNTTDEHLHDVTVTVRGPEGDEVAYSTPTLEPHETLSVGWLKLEGWPIPDGAKVKVSCKGYLTSVRYTVKP